MVQWLGVVFRVCSLLGFGIGGSGFRVQSLGSEDFHLTQKKCRFAEANSPTNPSTSPLLLLISRIN